MSRKSNLTLYEFWSLKLREQVMILYPIAIGYKFLIEQFFIGWVE